PKEYRDSVIFGSIHGCSIKRNVLKPNGSTFIASEAEDFLVSGDKNFRPINLRWGHNGEIYCIDWHDQHPCHQTNPDDWDYEHGRVYRIQPKGLTTKKSEDLGAKGEKQLRDLMVEANPWTARTALRLLFERKKPGLVPPRDRDTFLADLWNSVADPENRGATMGLTSYATHGRKELMRAWGVRLLAEHPLMSKDQLQELVEEARREQSAV